MNMLESLIGKLIPSGGSACMLFDAYVDESGCDDYSRVLVIGCYLVERLSAIELDREWRAVLDEHKISCFHMVDAAHGNEEFSDMSVEERSTISRKMIDLIKKYVTWGCAIAIPVKRQRPRSIDSYSSAVQALFLTIQSVLDSEIPGEQVSIFLESGHESSPIAGLAIDSMRRKGLINKVRSHSFADKKDVALLQTADLLSWQVAKYIKDKAFNNRKTRKDFASLTERKHMVLYFNHIQDRILLISDSHPAHDRAERDRCIRELFNEGSVHTPQLKDWYSRKMDKTEPTAYFYGLPPPLLD